MAGDLLLIAVVVVFWWFLSSPKGLSTTRDAHSPGTLKRWAEGKNATSGNGYPGVSIHAAPLCCGAAERLKGVRYLSQDAPRLPLPGCKLKICNCRYIHHADRRSGNSDRRRLIGAKKDYILFFGNEDQRQGRGRRASDWASAYQIKHSSN